MSSNIIAQEIKESFKRYDSRIAIKFSILLGKSATEIQSDLVTALEDHAPSILTTKNWMRTISKGLFDMSDYSRFKRPLTACGDAQVAAVQQYLAEDRGKSCEEIAEDVLISKSSVHRLLLHKLDENIMFSRWISHLLTPDKKKDYKRRFSRQFIQRFQREQNGLLDRIVNLVETWVSLWNSGTKSQSAEWGDRYELDQRNHVESRIL
ncbi:histone-lysine N-methyltransferase SETMAR-like protein [Plakobranchus ocellatus]|uniref:Histone-lysine N-methyltransferase SETMAR-like protein n=1 Tax=Plakobranchus ocellatus TaxID=259542 RepID=A0AAV3Z7K7_9GAST|nr:histone-lysine N-methyltransferase SETMAR-like protein [Plakobranchus ocellatus]